MVVQLIRKRASRINSEIDMLKRVVLLALGCSMFTTTSAKEVQIKHGVVAVEIQHKGEPLQIRRNQDRKAKIMRFYQDTWRGTIQPLEPFKPHPVETVAELEVIDYIKQISDGDNSIVLIDARPSSALLITGIIPTAVQMTSDMFLNPELQEKMLSILSIREEEDSDNLDFSNAKTAVIYCNGLWCSKSPKLIRTLLAFNYPAEKIKYYRGGMQAWRSVGLTTVRP